MKMIHFCMEKQNLSLLQLPKAEGKTKGLSLLLSLLESLQEIFELLFYNLCS